MCVAVRPADGTCYIVLHTDLHVIMSRKFVLQTINENVRVSQVTQAKRNMMPTLTRRKKMEVGVYNGAVIGNKM